jgi:hypothetical protein
MQFKNLLSYEMESKRKYGSMQFHFRRNDKTKTEYILNFQTRYFTIKKDNKTKSSPAWFFSMRNYPNEIKSTTRKFSNLYTDEDISNNLVEMKKLLYIVGGV